MAQSKEEIIRYVNEWVAQMKQKSMQTPARTLPKLRWKRTTRPQCRSPPLPRRSACPIRRRGKSAAAFKNAPPLAQHLVF